MCPETGGLREDSLPANGRSQELRMEKMERVYKTMRNAGVTNIVVGSIMIAVGVTAGVLAIINGALLLKNKKGITF